MGFSVRPGKYSCRLCEERYPGCHDKCEKYQTELKSWKDEQEKVRKAKSKYMAIEDFQVSSVKRMKRGK